MLHVGFTFADVLNILPHWVHIFFLVGRSMRVFNFREDDLASNILQASSSDIGNSDSLMILSMSARTSSIFCFLSASCHLRNFMLFLSLAHSTLQFRIFILDVTNLLPHHAQCLSTGIGPSLACMVFLARAHFLPHSVLRTSDGSNSVPHWMQRVNDNVGSFCLINLHDEKSDHPRPNAFWLDPWGAWHGT